MTAALPPKDHTGASVFRPENLLREARRQRGLLDLPVPAVCVLDPDGDIVRHLQSSGTGQRHTGWACYHTDMWVTQVGNTPIGVVGNAVGASFAVLVAEQLAVSGAELIISVTSAGQLQQVDDATYVLIAQALRDEGTSSHYAPPSRWADIDADLLARLSSLHLVGSARVIVGRSWTTDAPYRETQKAIDAAAVLGAICVEMEAAALYTFAGSSRCDVVCFAHLTNTMAVDGDDFDKGEANGAHATLTLIRDVALALAPTPVQQRSRDFAVG